MSRSLGRSGSLPLLLCSVLVSCTVGGTGTAAQSLECSVVAREVASGITAERREVIRNAETWTRVWQQIHSNTSELPARPEVDFEQQMLILVATGPRRTTGYSVSVEQVSVVGKAIEIEVRESCPSRGSAVGMMMSQPLEVVRCPRAEGRVSFRVLRDDDCSRL